MLFIHFSHDISFWRFMIYSLPLNLSTGNPDFNTEAFGGTLYIQTIAVLIIFSLTRNFQLYIVTFSQQDILLVCGKNEKSSWKLINVYTKQRVVQYCGPFI